MVYGWPVRLLRVLWIAFVIVSFIQVDQYAYGFFEWVFEVIFLFIRWIIAVLIPLQYILLDSINPKVLIEDFI